MTVSITIPFTELSFETSRAGGPGGQNVNKVETRVRALWNVRESSILTERQRELLLQHPDLASRLNQMGVLAVTSQVHRTQNLNRDAAIRRLHELVHAALTPKRKRVPTKVSRGVKERRLKAKRHRSETKSLRGSRIDRS